MCWTAQIFDKFGQTENMLDDPESRNNFIQHWGGRPLLGMLSNISQLNGEVAAKQLENNITDVWNQRLPYAILTRSIDDWYSHKMIIFS